MGERGPHDDFDSAKKAISAAFAGFNLDQDLEVLRSRFIAEDLEWVTRNGTFHGPDPYLDALGVQLKNWAWEADVEEVVDAGGGALIVLIHNRRINRETGEVAWKAWPAIVMRVHEGKMVFNEGYIDRRKAMVALGLERD